MECPQCYYQPRKSGKNENGKSIFMHYFNKSKSEKVLKYPQCYYVPKAEAEKSRHYPQCYYTLEKE